VCQRQRCLKSNPVGPELSYRGRSPWRSRTT
jgi:hypothetical protein